MRVGSTLKTGKPNRKQHYGVISSNTEQCGVIPCSQWEHGMTPYHRITRITPARRRHRFARLFPLQRPEPESDFSLRGLAAQGRMVSARDQIMHIVAVRKEIHGRTDNTGHHVLVG